MSHNPTPSRAPHPSLVARAASLLPKPLVRQAFLLLPVVVNSVYLLAVGALPGLGSWYSAGSLVLAAATVLAAVVQLRRLSGAVAVLVPVTDLAAVGLLRLAPEGTGTGILAVLPAMWLAADHGLRGVGLAAAGTLALVSAPSLVQRGDEVAAWVGGFSVPTVAVTCAFVVAGIVEMWRQQAARLQEQGIRLEEALAELTAGRALTEAIVDVANVGLVLLDRHGRYRLVNPRQRKYLQQAFPEGHGGRAGEYGFIYEPDRVTLVPKERRPSYRAMRGEVVTDELCWIGPDRDTQRALSVSARPLLDAEGLVDGAVMVYTDVTELMAALRTKDDFVASVSHELRTPLTSILGFLELVLDEPLDSAQRTQLETVRRNAERLLRLVTDLLLVGQIHGGRVTLDVEPVDLAEVAGQALGEHAPRAARGRVELRSRLAPGLVADADPLRVRQVVDNLVTNAVKYTPPGGSVTVRGSTTGSEVVLEVADTGIGVAAEDLPQLGTRFFRTRGAEDLGVQGLGLGLAITRSLLEAHGGRLEVESEPGRGSTFRAVLPRAGTRRRGPRPAEWAGAHLP